MSAESRDIWRKRNPHRHAWKNLQYHAKYRRIPFNLSFAEFLEIPEIDKYVFGKGRGKLDWTMDRIKPLSKEPRGYCAGNCQVLTNSDNVKKRNKEYDQPSYNPVGVPF